MTQARRQEMKWREGVFCKKKCTFPPQNETKLSQTLLCNLGVKKLQENVFVLNVIYMVPEIKIHKVCQNRTSGKVSRRGQRSRSFRSIPRLDTKLKHTSYVIIVVCEVLNQCFFLHILVVL